MSRLAAAALLALAAFLAGCGAGGGDTITGRVVEVDGDLLNVASFVVLTDDGTRRTFVPAAGLLFDHQAPLSHLQEHVRDGAPVVVEFTEQDDGTLVATSVGDG